MYSDMVWLTGYKEDWMAKGCLWFIGVCVCVCVCVCAPVYKGVDWEGQVNESLPFQRQSESCIFQHRERVCNLFTFAGSLAYMYNAPKPFSRF